ncbi:MAG: UvrD-helicase domain-containing protein [Flavobacteriales bacterium]|nr:UvrD-helicase domain-containing protein [Flavobacteriales bacterium]
MADYLEGLNPAQSEAVLHTEGPVMVIAGAGSGKTRVLTYRIAHLVAQGVDPYNILALTFTNKAAKEMKERIANVIGASDSKGLWMGTFHSVFSKILRMEADVLGYPSHFTIYDSDDSKKLINRIVKEMELDKDYYKARTISSRISSLKNNLITYKAYKNKPELIEDDQMRKMPFFGEIYEKYCTECFKQGAMDFDDLLLKTNELFMTQPQILAKYQGRFKYIMVDEYQDTNHSQYLIVKSLAAKFENICVVGDDAQSIYAFRGANIYNILNFNKDYPDLKKIKLEQNYRSTKSIVDAANSVIKKNQDQLEKKVWTDNEEGELISVYKTESDNHEAYLVSNLIWEESQRNGLPYSDYCIMYRTNAQSRVLEEAFRKKNIPYRIYGGLSFYQRKEIKDFMAYIRTVINPQDNEAVRRIINFPTRGIGQTSQDRLNIAANQASLSWLETIENIHLHPHKIASGGLRKMQQFLLMIKNMQVEAGKLDAYGAATYILNRSGLLEDLKKDLIPENISKIQNLEELLNAIQDFCNNEDNEDTSLSAFLEDVALLTDADQKDDDPNHISLMTIHQSKGLEFPYVYIVGMEEDLFPSMNTEHSREAMEEERRLFYVAITRAEKRATLSYALSRYRWGKLTMAEPSRFLDDIDEAFLDFKFASIKRPSSKKEKTEEKKKFVPKLTRGRNLKKINTTVRRNAPSSGEVLKEFQAGMVVNHHAFGNGTIVDKTDEGVNSRLTIRFDNGDVKTLIAKFAKLTKVNS